MQPRVLILSAAVGVGHLRAAEAVELAVRELAPEAFVQNTDVLSLTNSIFRRIYGKMYIDLVNHAPHFLGYMYDWMDRPRRPKYPPDRLRLIIERLNLGQLLDLLRQEHWDVIVSTHFLPAELIASLRRKRKIHTPQITVTTDFDSHRMWVNQPCELYTTATSEAAAYLHSYGVPPEHTIVTGIPIHPVFSRPKSRQHCLDSHGLDGSRPVVLQLAGGFGVGPVAKLFQSILSAPTPLQMIVVAGKNAKAKKQLEAVAVPRRHKAAIFGFTDKIDELMGAADIVVSKPGGLTTSEAISRGAAMAIVNPIPGQEIRNSDYLLENCAAIKLNNLPTAGLKLDALLTNAPRLESLKCNARRLARPRAAFDVAELALQMARRGQGHHRRLAAAEFSLPSAEL
jgi:processive 1,2-diacylglycerol beta-glucosyltransferase